VWYALAVWLMTTPPTVVPVVMQTFETKSECIEYITDNSDFNETVLDMYHITILDDGIKDMFGVACQVKTQET